MYITSTTRAIAKPQSATPTMKAQGSEEATQEVAAPADSVAISVSIPRNLVRRGAVSGLGAAAGMGLSYLLGGGLGTGLGLGAAAVGGLAGAVLSSETVGNAISSYRAAQKQRAIEQRVQRESAQQAEKMVQSRIQEQAEQKFQAQWATSGETMVEKRVEARLSERVEKEAAPKVEAEFQKRLDSAVAERVESKLKSEKATIDSRVQSEADDIIEMMVDEAVDARAETELEKRIDSVVDEKVEAALQERQEEIDSKVETGVQAAIDAEIQKALDKRQAPGDHVAELELHYKLAKKAAGDSYAAGYKVLRDGFEIISSSSSTMGAIDKELMKAVVEDSESEYCISLKNKQYAKRSRYKALEQTLGVLKTSSEASISSLNPQSYLDQLGGHNTTWDSGRMLMRAGLKVLAKHGELSVSEKAIAKKAASGNGLGFEADYKHMKNVLKLLAGQEI